MDGIRMGIPGQVNLNRTNGWHDGRGWNVSCFRLICGDAAAAGAPLCVTGIYPVVVSGPGRSRGFFLKVPTLTLLYMLNILEQAKALTADVLSAGDIAVDATLGNGYDAVHLARAIQPGGRLYGIDIQEQAVSSTEERLASEQLTGCATLVRGDHAAMIDLLPSDVIGRVGAVMFNLGYLPGSDHLNPTQSATTLQALEQAVQLIRPGGRITVVIYRGHAAGQAEYRAIMDRVPTWDQRALEVLHYRFINQVNDPPELLAVEKVAG